MKKFYKTIDFLMAIVIFILAINEFISWRLCYSENYIGDVKGSVYLLYYYPLSNCIGYFVIASYFSLKTIKYKLCIYTILVTWIYFIIQSINLIAVITQFGSELYNKIIYPILLFSIFGLSIIKLIRWFSQKHL